MKITLKAVSVLLGALLALCGAGCAVSPLTQETMERDEQSYAIPEDIQEEIAKARKELENKEVSILVDSHALAESRLVTANQLPMIRENLKADINTRLLAIPFFRARPSDPLLEKMTAAEYKDFIDKKQAKKLSQSDPLYKTDLPDYTVIATITYISSTTVDWQPRTVQAPVARPEKGDAAETMVADTDKVAEDPTEFIPPDTIVVKMAMELYDVNARRPLYSRIIHRKVLGVADQSIQDSIIQGLSDCAKEYIGIIADKLGSWGRGRVLKTVGNGRFARISLGSDAGLEQGSMIAFYEVDTTGVDPLMSNIERKDINFEVPMSAVAFGQVVNSIPIEKSASWVKIRDWKEVSVMQGQLVGHITYEGE